LRVGSITTTTVTSSGILAHNFSSSPGGGPELPALPQERAGLISQRCLMGRTARHIHSEADLVHLATPLIAIHSVFTQDPVVVAGTEARPEGL
jgi:hypothetical protein